MNTARRDDSCPYEWAEYNLPQELRPATKAVSPFARLVLDAAMAAESSDNASFDARGSNRSRLGSLLIPGLGFPLPKL